MTAAEATSPASNAVDTSGATSLAKASDNSATAKADAHAPVLGPIEDELFGKRIRKSFGSRAFWGTIVTSYVVGGGVFYKVSFDDGDVDVFSAGEVLRDLAAAKRHADEDPCAKSSESAVEGSGEATASSPALSSYVDALRAKRATLKRRRGSSDSDHSEDSSLPVGVSWEVKLWSVRLFATIMEEQGYIRLHEFVRMANGEPGEMEATGKIKPGDALIAVQGRVVHGRMDHTRACDLIRAAPRPVTLTFVRPPMDNDSAGAAAVDAAIEAIQESSSVSTSEPTADEAVRKKARVDKQTSRTTTREPPSTPGESPSKASPLPESTVAPSTSVAVSRGPQAHSRPPTPETRAPQEELTTPAATVPHVQGHSSAVNPPPRGLPRTPSPPVSVSMVGALSAGGTVASEPPNPSSRLRQPQSRTPSPAPPVDGAAGDRSSHASSRAVAFQAPGQNMAQVPGSSQLQTVFIPAHLAPAGKAPLPSSSGRVSRYFGPRSVSAPMAPSGQPAYHQQHAPMNDGDNGGVPATSRAMHATSNMIGAPRHGLHRYDPSTRTYFAPPAGSSLLSLGQRPLAHTNGTQDPRYTYSRQMYGPASYSTPPLSHAPNAPYQPHSSSTHLQHLPVQQRDHLLRGDERARSMTLGDYMVYTAQQERLALRLASENGNLGGARSAPQHPQLLSSSLPAQEPLTNPPLAPETNHQHRESSPPPVSDEGSSFLDPSSGTRGAVSDTPASTGSSFLSLDQISLLEEIPVNGKTKASRMHTAFRQATEASHDPPFLRKYESDGVVKVVVSQPRLYLTLAPLGQYVSISSFVRGDLGEVGEIEASGKVLPGDVLIGVGSLEIPPFMPPGDVARIVNSQPRPYSAYFIRATWEMLE